MPASPRRSASMACALSALALACHPAPWAVAAPGETVSDSARAPVVERAGAGRDSAPVAGPRVGTAGEDHFDGGPGDEYFSAEAGNDRLDGGAGNDRLDGGADDDRLIGGSGDDHLFGGEGDDRLIGGEGDDYLLGGPGRDELAGDAGADTFALDATALESPDTITDLRAAQGDRVLLLPELLQRIPPGLEKRLRIRGGELQVQLQDGWQPVAEGLEGNLSFRVQPRGRSALLVFQARF